MIAALGAKGLAMVESEGKIVTKLEGKGLIEGFDLMRCVLREAMISPKLVDEPGHENGVTWYELGDDAGEIFAAVMEEDDPVNFSDVSEVQTEP